MARPVDAGGTDGCRAGLRAFAPRSVRRDDVDVAGDDVAGDDVAGDDVAGDDVAGDDAACPVVAPVAPVSDAPVAPVSDASACATPVPVTTAALTPSTTASAPIRPIWAAALFGRLINDLLCLVANYRPWLLANVGRPRCGSGHPQLYSHRPHRFQCHCQRPRRTTWEVKRPVGSGVALVRIRRFQQKRSGVSLGPWQPTEAGLTDRRATPPSWR